MKKFYNDDNSESGSILNILPDSKIHFVDALDVDCSLEDTVARIRRIIDWPRLFAAAFLSPSLPLAIASVVTSSMADFVISLENFLRNNFFQIDKLEYRIVFRQNVQQQLAPADFDAMLTSLFRQVVDRIIVDAENPPANSKLQVDIIAPNLPHGEILILIENIVLIQSSYIGAISIPFVRMDYVGAETMERTVQKYFISGNEIDLNYGLDLGRVGAVGVVP